MNIFGELQHEILRFEIRVSKNLVFNQYAIYNLTVSEYCLAMNVKSDRMIERVEMVFLKDATLGMVSEIINDVMRINLYSFSTVSRSGTFFIEFYVAFTTRINQNPNFNIIDLQLCFCVFLDFWFSNFRYSFPLRVTNASNNYFITK